MRKQTMKNKDRLSNLPGAVVDNIFSFLGNMTEIVKTSILSKRWRYLWTSAPNLVFEFLEEEDDDDFERLCYHTDSEDGVYVGRLEKFFKFIDHVLSPQYTSNINKLSILCIAKMDDNVTNQIEKFVVAALRRNVQEIELHCNFDSGGDLTDHLFTSHLRVLKVTNYGKPLIDCGDSGMYVPKSIASASNIRILKLEGVVLPTTDTGEVIIHSPVLERLKISHCRISDAKTFTVSAPLLNKFELKNIDCTKGYMDREKNYSINVRSSNLKYLILRDYYFSGNFMLENPLTLTSANINLHFKDYKKQFPQCLMKVLAEISNVKFLAIPYHLVEIMANSPIMLEMLANNFQKLQHLILFEDFTGYFSYNPVATVLQTFPPKVDYILDTRDVPVDPSSDDALKKLMEQKGLSSS